jgi:peptidoglycan/LPS O-acetylase OafA/YrhL
MHFFPAHREWYFNLALAVPTTLFFAFLSWNVVEKNVLYLKNHPQVRRFMDYPVRIHAWNKLKPGLKILMLKTDKA